MSVTRATDSLVSLAAIEAAAERVRPVARVTPILPLSSDPAWQHVLLKCENLQVSGAFKIRGAFNMMASLPEAVRRRGVITYSSGNHGQAVAYAARYLGVPAVVVMPTTAPAVKVEGARSYGAEVVFAGTTSLDRQAAAEVLERERNLVMVPPFDHEAIIAGQGTVGLEIARQQPDVSTVYVPAGGGGLVSGVAVALKALRPAVRVIGVEPAGAPKMSASLAAGEPTTLARSESIADGLLAIRPGAVTFAHVRSLVDEIVQVSDDEIRGAVRVIARQAKLVVEPSGAVTVAGALRVAPPGTPGVHVCVVSGGNIGLAEFATFLA
jgi:threonine dehydratase